MNNYKLLVKVGEETRNTDILNMSVIGAIGNVFMDVDSGSISASGTSRAYTPNGVAITGGQTYYIKGAKKVCFYTAQGTDNADWISKFVGYSGDPFFNPAGQSFTAPATATYMRITSEDGETDLSIEVFYLIVGADPVVRFGVYGVWSWLDIGDNKPAMNYQTNDISELKDRQADYSQEITLPLSRHNLATLGLPDQVDSETEFPYNNIECRLFAGEYELAGRGAVLILDTILTDGISSQILGANVNLFDLLQDSPMALLTEPSFYRAVNGPVSAAGLVWVAASFTKQGFHHLHEMDLRYMLPVVNDMFMLEAILTYQGYTWEHNLAQYPGVEKNALPVVTLDPDADSLLMFDSAASRANAVAPLASGGINYNKLTVSASGTDTLVAFGTDLTSTEAGVALTPTFPAKIKVRFQTSVATCPDPVSVRVVLIKAGDTDDVFDSGWVNPTTTAIDSTELEIDVEKDNVINVLLSARSNGVTASPKVITGLNATLTIDQYSAEAVPVYGKVHAPRNLGFETQFDYFKAFVQRYGLTVSVDHSAKVVKTYTMKALYDGKMFAKDWSYKVIDSGRELAFKLGSYARSNSIKLKDNSEDKVKDSGIFTVSDATLAKQKDLFDIGIEAGYDWGETTKYASIPVFDVPDLDDTITTDLERLGAATYSGGEPHLVRVSDDGVELWVTGGGDTGTFKRITHVTGQSLVDDFLAELTTKMLDKAKVLLQNVYLAPADIEAFDQFTPIYLKQYGAYFYVNKIRNFVEGKVTTIEIIKL